MENYNIENYEGRLSLFFRSFRGLEYKILYDYLGKSCIENINETIRIVFYLRDPRGGKGERLLGQKCMVWLFINYPCEFEKVLTYIPEYGRWDDLLYFFPSVLKVSDFKTFKENISEGEKDVIVKLQKKVVNMMVLQLKDDLSNMFKGKPCSLCAKWTPTEGDSLDRETGVFKELCDEMGVSPKNFRKTFNTPLRAYLEVVESYMCNNKWCNIDFSKVPSVAMQKLKNAFERHDPERFKEWKNSFKRINYLPHEIVKQIRVNNKCNDILESAWKDNINEVKEKSFLKNSIAIVDVSNSIELKNDPYLDVAISTGLIISQLSEGLFHNHLITFNSNPKFELIQEGGLYDKFNKIKSMVSEESINIEGSLRIILDKVLESGQKQPPKRIFIISYFEQPSSIDLKNIKGVYKSHGFTLPQIVFWSVNDKHSIYEDEDKIVIKGFSRLILNSIIHINDLSYISIMNNIIQSARYNSLTKQLYPETPETPEDDIEILYIPIEENENKDKSYCSIM